ncbi:uncharacterized protein NECHADRAFT_77448 [Fusarium vanettenii 77-13-4]|uniref:Uncharacterized protein n=1 Tax=Fusarium vanettenii (strain ATCC MYA-4622 / CBS 123669 / FGSC 9596 / NRRL 45880 / 77-13-4) TaxID=660122 RepID=C7YL92_FUSV7|nr:uncharacterized protein NECHADRAFT_77448 [Fusarium vanettenii 77-13-4]EEU46747.1 predicted protein [Fusarium vanettenii 77-13-4]
MASNQATSPEGITSASTSAPASTSTSTSNIMAAQTTSAPEDPFAAVLALARVTLTSAPAPTSPPGPGDDARVDGAALPDEWRQDPEHPERCIEAWRRSTSQKYGHLLGDITSRDESGRLVARSRGFPSPAPSDDKHRNTTFIWVEKAGFDTKRIDLADLPKRADPDTGKDNVEVKRIEDVWEYDNPTLDTPHQFERGIDISQKAEGIEWEPHRLLGPDPGARAPISTSKAFVPNSELSNDFLASTSRGHQPKVPRPSRVGAGWGDHDKFREWQLHGRALTKDMTEDKACAHEEPATLQYVPGKDAEEGAENIVVTASLARDDPEQPEPFADRQRPRTVRECFETRRYGEASREGHQQGRRQRGRGRGRGGQGLDDGTW